MTGGLPVWELSELLASNAATRRSGVLTAEQGKLKRLVCLLEGRLAFAASNVLEEQFEATLIDAGLLSAGDSQAITRDARSAGHLAAWLKEHRGVDEAALEQAMERHLRHLVSSCLEWPEGSFRFEAGTPKLDGRVTARLRVGDVLLDHVREHPADVDLVRPRIGNPGVRLTPVAGREALLPASEPGAVARQVLELCDGQRPLGEVLEGSPFDEEPTLRALYALRLIGAVVPPRADERPEAILAEPGRPLTREEVEARLSKSEGVDHYMVLGVEPSADQARIRNSYYDLARRMHPDRFRSGELLDLLPRVEIFFSKVTEAYNTLHDAGRRSEYDDWLAGGKSADDDAGAESDSSFLARQNYLRGRELAERRRNSEAVKFLRNAVDLDGTKADYVLELGVLLARNPRARDEAERALLKAVELSPTATRAYMALGDLYRRSSRVDEAVGMYREVLRWEPNDVTAAERLKELGHGGRTKGLFRS